MKHARRNRSSNNRFSQTTRAVPSFGHYLTARNKTGYFFSYNTHPDRPVIWKF